MEELNRLIENHINEYEINDFEELSFISKLVSIVDKYNINLKDKKTKSSVRFNKNFKYSYDFLKTIDPDYASYLLKIKEEGVFDILKDKEGCPYSTVKDDGKHYIYMPLQSNIIDSYSITHEVIHDLSISEDSDNSLTRHLFCEVFSLLSEMLQRDYFKNTTKPKGYNIENSTILGGVYSKKRTIMLDLNLIKAYLESGHLSFNQVGEIFSIYTDEEIDDEIIYYLQEILETGELTYGYEQRYIIGYLFASYMHDRIIEDPKKIEEFVELNDIINEYDISDFLHYLDLDFKNKYIQVDDTEVYPLILDLTDESYDKLERSFVKELKRR